MRRHVGYWLAYAFILVVDAIDRCGDYIGAVQNERDRRKP